MRVAVIGVGLIGGSLGLAARACGHEVRGVGRDPERLAKARELGAIDLAAGSLEEALAGAEACFCCAPVGALSGQVAAALEAAGRDCVVSDVGSVKGEIVATARDERFVGGHPLAGAETAGVEHARRDLFAGATWYLTPTERTSGVLYERLHRLLHELGARPAAIDVGRHDRMMATVSHLPHVLANVLAAQAAGSLGGEDGGEPLPATGPSFRDATRVAGANSAIWTDIYLSNRAALIEQLDETARRLEAVRAALAAGSESDLRAWNEDARAARQRVLDGALVGDEVHELRISVTNEPGVVARLALELGRAGINIADMALYPAADMRDGVVAVWVAGEEPARRAQELVGALGHPVARP